MSVTVPAGFVAAGGACGIKPAGGPDLALVATHDGVAVPAAAVFTANRATAAPVQVSRSHLAASGGRAAAVVLNSGNANAATGEAGRDHARRMAAATAGEVGCAPQEVLVCSTGLIGIPLPVDLVEKALPTLAAGRSVEGAAEAAAAILTTDTRAKQARVEGPGFTVGGMAKGAAMLSPRMATMLAVLTTDAAVDHPTLQGALAAAVAGSFNALTVDGCTSTNDTVIVLASGRAGPERAEGDLARALAAACADLARQMAADAEGATKLVTVRVTGARSDADAHLAARAVAESQLVKCSLYGGDPYWGRVVSELGSAGVDFDPDRVTVAYGGVEVCRKGVAAVHDPEALAAAMGAYEITLAADLGLGTGRGEVLSTDLTPDYIAENMRTS